MTIIPAFALATTDTLLKSDFLQQSFQKTVDYFDYARAYATLHGISTPDNFDDWHANMYMTYVNTSGIQLLYAGLELTTDGSNYSEYRLNPPLCTIKRMEQVRCACSFHISDAYGFFDSSTQFEGHRRK
jgi:hypothetical protein